MLVTDVKTKKMSQTDQSQFLKIYKIHNTVSSHSNATKKVLPRKNNSKVNELQTQK